MNTTKLSTPMRFLAQPGRPPLVGRSDRVGVFLYISEIMRLMDVPDEPGLPLGWEGVPVIE